MKKLIKDITSIQTGVFAKTVPIGDIVYLNAKHFDENGQLSSILHPDLDKNDLNQKHLLRYGDVLFAAKGTKNFATCSENINQPAVASTSFFVIRLNEFWLEVISPEFLAWSINQTSSQKFLKERAIGTSIVSISKAVLEELEISIPDLAIQKVILKISQLRRSEKNIKQKVEELKEKQIQQIIINAIR